MTTITCLNQPNRHQFAILRYGNRTGELYSFLYSVHDTPLAVSPQADSTSLLHVRSYGGETSKAVESVRLQRTVTSEGIWTGADGQRNSRRDQSIACLLDFLQSIVTEELKLHKKKEKRKRRMQ